MTIPKKIIRRRFEVQDGDRTVVHCASEAHQPIGGAGGNLLFIGLPGSGRRTLARAAAERLGLAFAETTDVAGLAELTGLTESAAQAESTGRAGLGGQTGQSGKLATLGASAEMDSLLALMAKPGQAIAVTGVDLRPAEVRDRLRAAGKVFYLMSAAPILARRLGDLSRLEELARAVDTFDPFYLQAAHFVLPLDATPEEMVEDVVEKARL